MGWPRRAGTVTPDGRLHGRGSCDTKATLANICTLLAEQKAAGVPLLKYNLVVAGTVGEETSSLGAEAFKAWLGGRGIVLSQLMVAEPTLCRAIYGHKGHVRLTFVVKGVPCHSSQPGLGRNAVTAAARLILRLNEEHSRLQSLPAVDLPLGRVKAATRAAAHPARQLRAVCRGTAAAQLGGAPRRRLRTRVWRGAFPHTQPRTLACAHTRMLACGHRHGTLATTLVDGGSGINIIPGEASISIDRRVVAGESARQVRRSALAGLSGLAYCSALAGLSRLVHLGPLAGLSGLVRVPPRPLGRRGLRAR